MKKNIEYVFLIFGLVIMTISSADVVSIIANLLEKILNIDLYAAFFSSFFFRVILMLFGGLFLCIGGVMLKKREILTNLSSNI